MSKETHRLAVSGNVPLREGDGSAAFVGSALYDAFYGLNAVAAGQGKDILWSTLRIETKVTDLLDGDAEEGMADVLGQLLNVEVEVMGVERG